jgi:hypothetical protein
MLWAGDNQYTTYASNYYALYWSCDVEVPEEWLECCLSVVLWDWTLMPGDVPGSFGGSLGHPFKMYGVREYKSKCPLGQRRY